MTSSQVMDSETISVRICRSPGDVYAFASAAENFPKWASGLAQGLERDGEEWIAHTPEGNARLRLTKPNAFGVLDHYVIPKPGVEIYSPMRVIANGTGSEVLFTLFRLPDMTAEDFRRDAEWVQRDLQTLKRVLEAELG